MRLLDLLRRESAVNLWSVALIAAVSGLTNAMILAVINAAVGTIGRHQSTLPFLILFVAVLLGNVLARRTLRSVTTREIEAVVNRLRTRLAAKILDAGLLALERVGRSQINTALTRDTSTISQSAIIVVQAAQSASIVLFTSLYMYWLSPGAFLMFLIVVITAVLIYLRRKKELEAGLQKASMHENALLDAIVQLLNGFKEVKLNRVRGRELLDEIGARSESACAVKTEVGVEIAMLGIFSQTAIFIGVAAIVFLLPQFSTTDYQDVVKLTTAVLFITAPVTSLIGALPDMADANVAAENVYILEASLNSAGERLPQVPTPRMERELALAAITFSFDDEGSGDAFRVGPIDLTLPAGSTTFIAGGNGSGKSTLLKLLTGLYLPASGVIRLDGDAVESRSYTGYRNLFSAIFQDFYIFDRLYGIDADQAPKIDQLLETMEIRQKIRFDGTNLEAAHLSVGQRKRLAMVIALLEDRPLYVFDEWAADQDPVFRDHFYRDLLPALKARGKTVIAVTHDDRYYGMADRTYRMKDGLLYLEEPQPPTEPARRSA